MIEQTYNVGLVLGSIAISMMASFTGLWLTRGLAQLGPGARQARISMAAIALGGGIWSMHFTAMLAIRLPIPVSYDTLPTLASLLIAILLSGIALLIMHFARRDSLHFILAGSTLGLGIVVMHYTGMAAMQLCRPVYDTTSIVAAAILAPILGTAAIWVAYGHRTRKNILLGTAILGSTVVVVHFAAMSGTGFYALEGLQGFTPVLTNQDLALIVLLGAFGICGGFLLAGTTFLVTATDPVGALAQTVAAYPPAPKPEPIGDGPGSAAAKPVRIPVERRGHTEFVDASDIAALEAEGHYTYAYCCEDRFFCTWSISEAEDRLADANFFRAHRSYLVNLGRVTGFERHRDGGSCLFDDIRMLDRVPVSRNKVSALRDALGL